VKQRTRSEHPLTVVQKRITSAYKPGAPLAVGIEFHTLVARREQDGTRSRVGDCNSIREDAFHACIRGKGLALLDANRGKQSDDLRVESIARFVLNDGVDFLVEVEGVGVNGVELNTGQIDERLRRWVARRGQRIDSPFGLDALRGARDIPALYEGAIEHQIGVGRRLHHEIAARWQLAAPVVASMSCPVMRTRFVDLRTLPSST
jgi:hypothetical protein